MLKRAILILALLLCLPVGAEAEWKQITQGDSNFCVSDTGQVAKCSLDDKGGLVIGDSINTRAGKCPT